MQRSELRIIIFGFAGAGKSTTAEAIGKHYGLRIVHPSGIMRMIAAQQTVDTEKAPYGRGFWETPRGIALFKSRLNEEAPLDLIADTYLIEELEKGGVAMDSWNMPWLYPGGIKIYLKVLQAERIQRVSRRSTIDLSSAQNIVDMKDNETHTLFKRLYDIDIKHDHDVFDLVVDASEQTKKEVVERLISYIDSRLSSHENAQI